MSESFCSKEHSDLHEQEKSNVAFQRVMGVRAQAGSAAGTGQAAPVPRPEFTGQEWAQTAEAFASSPARQALSADSPAPAAPLAETQETDQEWNLRKDLTAMLEVAQHPAPAVEAISTSELVGATMTQANASTAFGGVTTEFPGGRAGTPPAANLWGKAARSLLYPGNEVGGMQSLASAVGSAAGVSSGPSGAVASIQPNRVAKSWSSKQWIMVGIAAACSILAVGALLFGPLVKPVQAPQPSPAARVSPSAVSQAVPVPVPQAPAPAAVAAKAAPVPTPVPLPAAAPTPVPAAAGLLHASLVASDPSWVVACADNKVLFAKLFTAGATQDIAFTSRAVVRIGRPAAIHVAVGGTAVPPPSGMVQVSLIELTPGGARYLENGAPNDCTHGL